MRRGDDHTVHDRPRDQTGRLQREELAATRDRPATLRRGVVGRLIRALALQLALSLVAWAIVLLFILSMVLSCCAVEPGSYRTGALQSASALGRGNGAAQ